ncbi:MAG: MtrB/PioB family decaheme-associated outer membrane protein [Gammaproteobacteria bacterium]|nr:MtrB/PioB family decaheme-associated outer membrane protein [Gammaproteobacteria bacterium]
MRADDTTSTCIVCVDQGDLRGEMELGAAWVSDDAFRFGHHSGLDERGLYAVGALTLELARDNGTLWQLRGTDLGLDSRSLAISVSEPGRYGLQVAYSRTPSRLYDNGRTPFASGSTLTLPSGWVSAVDTGGMDALAVTLSPVEIRSDRDNLAIGFRFSPDTRWRYDLDYRYSERDGAALMSGSYLNRSTELVRPLNDEMHSIDTGISYAAENWQARLGYTGSFYTTSTPALRWQNPYLPPTPGADQGELALEPDNEFHQLMLSGQYGWSPTTRLSGSLAAGRMTQDEALLAFTLNPGLAATLPRTHAAVEVDTLHADLRLTSRPVSALRLGATWVYDDRDNDTPVTAWSYVNTDAIPEPAARENPLYGYTRERIELTGDYRFATRISSAAGYGHETVERDQAEVRHTREDEIWGQLRLALGAATDLRLRYTIADRDVSDYQSVPGIPAENPLLRKYNLADREQGVLELALDLRPRENLDVVVSAELRDDDYSDSLLGLQSARHEALNIDGSLVLPGSIVLGATLGYEDIHSRQAGSQAFAAPDWSASNDDETRFAMLSLDLPAVLDRWRLRLSYTRAETEGAISIDQSGFVSPFPDLETELHRFELHSRYQLRDRWSLLFRYAYEDYGVRDWSRDGVLPDTLPRVLALGAMWQDYSVHVFSLSVSCQLGADLTTGR